MAIGKKVGDAYIAVHADTKPFAAELKKLRAMVDKNFGQVDKSLGKTDQQVKKVTDSTKNLGTETTKTGKKWTKTMVSNRRRTLALTDSVADLRKKLMEVRRVAVKSGDEGLLGKIDDQLKGLTMTMREHRKELVGLTIKDKEYGEVLTKTGQRIRARVLNALKLEKATQEALERTKRATEEAAEALKRNTKETDHAHRSSHRLRRSFILLGTVIRTLNKPFLGFAHSVRTSWRRMDSTVRIVLALILAAAPQIAALSSSVGSSLTAIAIAAGGALLSLAPLVGLIAPLGYGIALFATGMKDLEKFSKPAAEALDNLSRVFKEVNLPAFMSGVAGPLTQVLQDLADSLEFDGVAKRLGEAFGAILTALDNTIRSEAWAEFIGAIEGPLANALETLGSTFTGPLLEALLDFMSATAPVAEQLANMFEAWAENIATFFREGKESGTMLEFFQGLVPLLQSVLDFFGNLKDIIAVVFEAGQGPATKLFNLINDTLNTFLDWLNSAEGQTALDEWFNNMLIIMPHVFDLIGAIGEGLADLVTPEAVKSLTDLLDGLADIVPILSDVLGLLAEAGILDLFVSLLKALGEVIEPLIEPLGDFLSVLSGELIRVLEEAAPYLDDMATVFGELLEAIIPVIPEFADLIIGLLPILPGLLRAIVPLFLALSEVLIDLITPFTENKELMDGLVTIITVSATVVSKLLEVMIQLFGLFLRFATPLGSLVTGLEKAKGQFDKVRTAISDFFKSAAFQTWYNTQVKPWIDKMKDGLQAVKTVVGIVGTAIKNSLRDAFNAVARAWNNTIGKLSWTVPSWVPKIGGQTIAAPKIPTFARGGFSDRPAIFGEDGGELAVPVDKPLHQVDPSVRWLSALVQGKAAPGDTSTDKSVTIAAGAIQVSAPQSDPRLVAESLLDQIVAKAR